MSTQRSTRRSRIEHARRREADNAFAQAKDDAVRDNEELTEEIEGPRAKRHVRGGADLYEEEEWEADFLS